LLALGLQDEFDTGSVFISAGSGVLGIGLAGRFAKFGGLAVDVTTSIVSKALKGDEITLEGVAIDVAAGRVGGKIGEKAFRGSEAFKVAERQASRLERIGRKAGARRAQRARAESARPALAKEAAEQGARAGIVASGAASTTEEVVNGFDGIRVDRVEGRVDSARLRDELDR
jgi:hypothetical protein